MTNLERKNKFNGQNRYGLFYIRMGRKKWGETKRIKNSTIGMYFAWNLYNHHCRRDGYLEEDVSEQKESYKLRV